MLAPAQSGAVLADVSAAKAWGLPLPFWLSGEVPSASIAVVAGRSRPQRNGVRGRRLRLPEGHLTSAHGLRLTTPARTWLDCAAFMPVEHVVAMGDAVLHRQLATVGELRDITHWAFRRRGVTKCRRSLDLLDAAAESPGESLTRMALVAGGLPRPECNVNVFDEGGGWLARADMLWRSARVIVEYDGAVHLEESRRRRDAQRRNLLQDAGWLVIVVTANDLRTPWRLVDLVGRALAVRGTFA